MNSRITNIINLFENSEASIFQTPKFNCLYCPLQFGSSSILQDHLDAFHTTTNTNVITYTNISDNNHEFDPCRCHKCDLIFENDHAYGSHICGDKLNGYEINDIENMGDYKCPLCDKIYLNQHLLGEHFILAHNNYEDYCDLDDKIIRNGFPGFEILELLGMINIENNDEILEKCSICYENFDLDEKTPTLLNCCKINICYYCLENHLTKTNSVICPFCKKDHTNTNLDYLIIMEQDEKIDPTKWVDWWKNHKDILG